MLNAGFYNMDCMIGMKQFPDKFFELAIVDPPYFSGPERREYYGKKESSIGVKRIYKPVSAWSVPGQQYFDELFRISQNAIVWGENYYQYQFGKGRIVWDKCNQSSSFSDCEIAFCSAHDSVRLFRFMWNGMLQGKGVLDGHLMLGDKSLNEIRIHPTQKPVALYKWLLTNYAHKGDKILDTHVGSASSLIACHQLGFQYWGFELDLDYYKAASERLERAKAQVSMLDIAPDAVEQITL